MGVFGARHFLEAMTLFTCNYQATPTPFLHSWEHTVGSGHAPLALRADWQAHLRRAHAELGFKYVRFHGLLSEPMGVVVDHDGEFLYSFFNTNQIFDFLLSIGMRPFVELSFMPEPLASGEKTVFHYKSNVTPPKDYQQWRTLIGKLAQHWVEAYGTAEVSRWFFEVWNEPNLEHFWTGKKSDYYKLYRHAVEPIKRVDPSLQVGGPATAQGAWIEPFLEFCEREGLPADFISTHYYPTDAFGREDAPTDQQLAGTLPDVMAQRAREVFDQVRGRPLYFTEWNISSNPRHALHDEPFAAAFATRIVMGVNAWVNGFSYWTFSDIFEENYFPSVPFHGGFGLLNIHGIAKPVYRAFQLLHHLGDTLLPVEGTHHTVAVWASPGNPFTFLLINQAMPEQPIQTEQVDLQLTNAPAPRTAFVQRIDEAHANPRQAWVDMGKPEYLRPHEVENLQAISELRKEPLPWTYEQNTIHLSVSLPPQSVAALTLEFDTQTSGERMPPMR